MRPTMAALAAALPPPSTLPPPAPLACAANVPRHAPAHPAPARGLARCVSIGDGGTSTGASDQ